MASLNVCCNESSLSVFVKTHRIRACTMGRIFLDHIGGTRLFSCANCDTILTNRAELISTRFTGATGRAFLFNKVPAQNYLHLSPQEAVESTSGSSGNHIVLKDMRLTVSQVCAYVIILLLLHCCYSVHPHLLQCLCHSCIM